MEGVAGRVSFAEVFGREPKDASWRFIPPHLVLYDDAGLPRKPNPEDPGYCHLKLFERGGLGYEILSEPQYCWIHPGVLMDAVKRFGGNRCAYLSVTPELNVYHVELGWGDIIQDCAAVLARRDETVYRVIGALISDVISTCGHLSEKAIELVAELVEGTNDLAEDAAANYDRLGNMLESLASNGGLAGIGHATLTSIFTSVIGRWTTTRQAAAVARAATEATVGEVPWDPTVITDVLESEEMPEEEKEKRLYEIMGLFLIRKAGHHWSQYEARSVLRAWRASFVGVSRGFARAIGVNVSQVEEAATRIAESGCELLVDAVQVLQRHGLSAVTVGAKLAAGAALTAGVVVAAGLVLDWFYEDQELKKLGSKRVTVGGRSRGDWTYRATNLAAVAAVVSDEVYYQSTQPNSVRVDPFFFYVRKEVGQMKEDTDAEKLLVGSMINPLVATVNTKNKTVILVPATISHDSMMHIQMALPQFYYRIVDRHHSHPELWLARRAFEMIAAQRIASMSRPRPVVLVGGSVRQASKLPRVTVNYGPVLTGRDDSRRRLEGSQKQQAFYNTVTVNKPFGYPADCCYPGGVAVAPFSAQDMYKRDFIKSCISHGLTEAHVFVNIPLVLLDDRMTEWDDPVLCVKYVRREGKLYMAPLGAAVNGYCNTFDSVMSWAKPFDPIDGYDAVCEVVGQVSSSYHIQIKIGVGRQEEHLTMWKMPDAGYYVLQDLTREEEGLRFFATPAQKFDQVVKFLIHQTKTTSIVEAAAGRVVGLEAPIKLGMITLERSWELDHRQFASVVIHAVCCAQLDKGDVKRSLSDLEKYFSRYARDERGILGSAIHGWKKALGIARDERWITRMRYARSDYDPVTHWQMFQRAGEEASVGSLDSTSFTMPEGHSANTKSSKVDEGYESQGVAAVSSDSESESEAAVAVKPPPEKPREIPLQGLRGLEHSLRVLLPEGTSEELLTRSEFKPGVTAMRPDANSSRAHVRYWQMRDMYSDLASMIAAERYVPAPDSGVVEIIDALYNMPISEVSLKNTKFGAARPELPELTSMDAMVNSFFRGVPNHVSVRRPIGVLDGVAGSAKSSSVKIFCKTRGIKPLVVVPSRKLRTEWVASAVGSVVTQHSVTRKKLAGKTLLVIDEVYAYGHDEVGAYLKLAEECKVPVLLVGDREQQYVDGAQISTDDIDYLGAPIIRMYVSNTMPIDALFISKMCFKDRENLDLLQTRNPVLHSVFFVDPDSPGFEDFKVRAGYCNTLVFKDRCEVKLGWATPEEEFGYVELSEIGSISRVQGSRVDYAALTATAVTKVERWLGEQKGLLYVAISRHSKGMLFSCFRQDVGRLGIPLEPWVKVDGRLARKAERERFDAPFRVKIINDEQKSTILTLLQQRGALPQAYRSKSLGPVLEDWRPWRKMIMGDSDISLAVARYGALGLCGAREPFANTAAARLPIYQSQKGLYSVRRPLATEFEPVDAVFPGLDRLAVRQTSKDEVLDLKNVVERTARPRTLARDEIERKAQVLFERTMQAFFDVDRELPYSTEPAAEEWLETRTADFGRKFADSDPYGTTKASTVSDGFLKTQVKVKLSREFALEENYGQTVLATPADYNAIFGPWSKMYLRNVRLAAREGVILDSGYSDKEVARLWRKWGVLPGLADENLQADVSRQDTSHTPVTLAVFCKRLEFFGVPPDKVALYRKHSEAYEYKSIASGLYRGKADHNLGSGDPFTLIRNIDEVMCVMVERFDWRQIKASRLIIKGDDWLSDRVYDRVETFDKDIRATKLKLSINAPPYHAGRFFLSDDVVPDPVRMVVKAFVKKTDNPARANELAEAFYDRYVPIQANKYVELMHYCIKAYQDFDSGFIQSLVKLYVALEDRNLFFDLLSSVPAEARLAVIDTETGCASKAASWFTSDKRVLAALENVTMRELAAICKKHNIPAYQLRGRPGDYLKRGVWYTHTHAQAVVGLTEFNEHANLLGNQTDAHVGENDWSGYINFPGLQLVPTSVDGSDTSRAVCEGNDRSVRYRGRQVADGQGKSRLAQGKQIRFGAAQAA